MDGVPTVSTYGPYGSRIIWPVHWNGTNIGAISDAAREDFVRRLTRVSARISVIWANRAEYTVDTMYLLVNCRIVERLAGVRSWIQSLQILGGRFFNKGRYTTGVVEAGVRQFEAAVESIDTRLVYA